MNDEELEEYINKIDPNFNSHFEKGTIEMSNEYYNLLEERMARLINENQKLKKQQEINQKAIEYIKDFLCTEDYINVNGIAIADNYSEVLEILKGGEKDK